MYLVQRGKILTATVEENNPEHRLSKVVQLDYMGSAEFEWGALPGSLRRMGEQLNVDGPVTIGGILNAKGQSLRLFYGSDALYTPRNVSRLRGVYEKPTLEDQHQLRAEYVEKLHKLHAGEDLRLKEYSGFGKDAKHYGQITDLWWDIKNDIVWSFNKNFMNKLPIILKNSLDYMNAQKAKQE